MPTQRGGARRRPGTSSSSRSAWYRLSLSLALSLSLSLSLSLFLSLSLRPTLLCFHHRRILPVGVRTCFWEYNPG